MYGHDDHMWRDLGRALAEAFWFRRAIFDPPPWPGWPTRFRLRRKART